MPPPFSLFFPSCLLYFPFSTLYASSIFLFISSYLLYFPFSTLYASSIFLFISSYLLYFPSFSLFRSSLLHFPPSLPACLVSIRGVYDHTLTVYSLTLWPLFHKLRYIRQIQADAWVAWTPIPCHA